MKRIAVFFIVAAGILSGCHKSGIKPGESRISGIISPAILGYISVSAGPVLDSAKIHKNGRFNITIPVNEPVKARLILGNRLMDVYLEPGKEVLLEMNPIVSPDIVSYGGELGPVNHYLTLSRKLEQLTAMPVNELYAKEPEQFIRYSDSVKQLKIKLLDEYQAKYKEIDPGFVARTRSEIEFSWADQRLTYPSQYQQLKGRQPSIRPSYYTDFMGNLDLNQPLNLKSPVYKEFIQNYLDFRQSVYLFEHPTTAGLVFPGSVARFRVIHEEFTNPDIIDYLLFTAIDIHLANYGTTRIETFLTDFKVTCKNQEYIKAIETIVANLEKIGMGKPAMDFTAFTPEGKMVKLSDYFGQLLYIGFWASWSEWSLREIPYFEQLRRDFEGKPVKFIMVSLDFEKDKNLWSAIIKKNSFGSIQLLQDQKSNVLKYEYFLEDFPRYFLIDKEGKILSAYAPRPTENIAETLTRLINTSR